MTALTWARPQLNATLAAAATGPEPVSGRARNRYACNVTGRPTRAQRPHVPHDWRQPAVGTGARTATSGSPPGHGQGPHQPAQGPRPATCAKAPTARPRRTRARTLRSGL